MHKRSRTLSRSSTRVPSIAMATTVVRKEHFAKGSLQSVDIAELPKRGARDPQQCWCAPLNAVVQVQCHYADGMSPSFGIFDHIEDIPGTSTPQLLKDRLDLIKMADEAGFAGFHLAEHHGSDLCMAPNQEVFIAAASQITKNIRLGPMVKLLPLHHPVRIIEDMVVVDNLTNGRLDFGVGRGVAPIEHYWFGSNWPESRDRFVDVLGIICDAFATGEISSENSKFYDFPTIPMSTKPVQNPIPFWYPGSPVTAGRHGMNLMWPGPIDQASYDLYVETWNAHKGDTHRVDGPNSVPRVGCTMVLAIAPTEDEALDIVRRGMDGSAPSGPQRAQARPSGAVRRGVRRRARTAARHHGAHGRCHPPRCGHRRADQGSLRRHPRAGSHRLHRAAASNR